MEGILKIADDLYFVRHPVRPGWFCGITVVAGSEKLGLIDTGYENTPEEYLFPFLKELGRDVKEISLIYNTHGDGDHIEGNDVIKKAANATIVCHEQEADVIPSADETVTDGDSITLGDRVFTVVHCPGHRQGNTCLFDKSSSLLVTGDTIVGTRSELIRVGKEPYIASLKKIAALSPAAVLMSHPFDPAGKNFLKGKEIDEMIQASIKVAESIS